MEFFKSPLTEKHIDQIANAHIIDKPRFRIYFYSNQFQICYKVPSIWKLKNCTESEAYGLLEFENALRL